MDNQTMFLASWKWLATPKSIGRWGLKKKKYFSLKPLHEKNF
jgi:hypothetical protein